MNPPQNLSVPDISAPPPRKRGRGRPRLTPSGAAAARVSVYTTPAGLAWLEAQARAAGCGSIGQWADLQAMATEGKNADLSGHLEVSEMRVPT